ncbi:DNA topoisomerase I [Candidatus Gastranaerophilus sp. (ex Termes propinquus)]|nr:DNA topoisomerase I [Candidatus Gastranaerophilus sp. (ex Termes propinquus)]
MPKAVEEKKPKKKALKSLIIVESPAKSKTIKKILGESYTIEASYGHIRDLPSKGLGFDIENDFKPTFVVIPEKAKVVESLNKAAKSADRIYLASDPDREGEAIAWHVRQVLDVPDSKIQRIVFNEITPKAVKEAVETPRGIDMQKVKAQQTRQILDKLVGFKISPILWEKLRNYRLSAGRVQSVALRMIAEREAEIEAFVPVEYWSLGAVLSKNKFEFEAELSRHKDKKVEIKNKEEVDKIIKELEGAKYKVQKITPRDSVRKPSAPFITSTMQREASSKLGYGVSKTMQVAQKLYEGIELGEEGSVGLITYMRTDSVRISEDAQVAAKDYIFYNFGDKYYPKTPNDYAKKGKGGKNVQDAHEAIRPSYVEKTPESIKKYLSSEQYRLYKLIWSRFMASQMENAAVKNITVDIDAKDYVFKIGSSVVVFDGFLKVYQDDEETEVVKKFPELEVGDELKFHKLNPEQHFTQPPPRFSEASLVKQLEEYGIGRPSTYAPIITKIQQRGYVEKIEKALKPTILGRTVSEQLVKHFTDIMDYAFTASMEHKLDDIADDKAVPANVLNDFWKPFSQTVDSAKANMENVVIESDVNCPNCSKKMVVKTSRFGKQFLGCSGYPECKTMAPLGDGKSEPIPDEPSDELCEKCQGEMVAKVGPYGKYLQCLSAECKARKRIVVSTGVKCPKCTAEKRDGELIERKSRFGKIFYGCSKYPDCDFVVWAEPNGETCPDCGSLLVKKFLKRGNKIDCSSKECKYSKPMEE